MRAVEMFAVASSVAQEAGLKSEYRRLGYKSAELVGSRKLSNTERTQILRRFAEK